MDTPSKASFSVEFSGGVLHLRVWIGAKSFPIQIAPAEAAALGADLISGSVVRGSPDDEAVVDGAPPDGAVAARSLPVLRWRTGIVKEHQLAILMLDLVGGSQLTFQFSSTLGSACGLSLFEAGQTLTFGGP